MSSDNETAFAGLFIIAAGLCAWGFFTDWSFSPDRTYLVIDCPAGLNDGFRCATKDYKAVGPVHVHIKKNDKSVLIYTDKDQKSATSFNLSNCTIFSDSDWKCQKDNVLGVSKGRFYTISSQTIDMGLGLSYPVDRSSSSLVGWHYFLYRFGLETLPDALTSDGFVYASTQEPRPIPVPPVPQ